MISDRALRIMGNIGWGLVIAFLAVLLVLLLATYVEAQTPAAQSSPAPVEGGPSKIEVQSKKFSLVNVAIGAFAVSQFTDISGTMFCLGRGSCEEANPLFRPFQRNALAMGAAKGAGAVFIGDVLLRQRKDHPKRTAVIAFGLAAAYGALSYRNATFDGRRRQ